MHQEAMKQESDPFAPNKNYNHNPVMNNQHQQPNNTTNNEDGTWLLITSTMGITLGYVRIDDHDHPLTLAEIRRMINNKLADNAEYRHGWNFGTGWPLKIVHLNEEQHVFAKDVLPSVSVLSAHSAQHIVNNTNPMSAATAMQYGMSPAVNMNMNFSANVNMNMNMGFPQTGQINTANLQPLPISAIFTPVNVHPNHNGNMSANGGGNSAQTPNNNAQVQKAQGLPDSAQFYSPNTNNNIALLQPQPQSGTNPPSAVKDETSSASVSGPLLSAGTNASDAQIPSLPPFSPPTLTQEQMEERAKVQKAKLQNLLPRNLPGSALKAEKISSLKQSPENKKAKITPKSKNKGVVLPKLKPIGADGKVIETAEDDNKNRNSAMPTLQQQRDKYCPVCEKKFAKDRGYRQHMTKQHGVKLTKGRNKERRFDCQHPGCPKSFYQRSDLRRHQRVHLGVKPFKCLKCKKEFTQRGSLYRHIKGSHKGMDPKKLIILQTEETLPDGQKKTVETMEQDGVVMNENNHNNAQPESDISPQVVADAVSDLPPPLMNSEGVIVDDNGLPPQVPINSNFGNTSEPAAMNNNGLPPALENEQKDVMMTESVQE